MNSQMKEIRKVFLAQGEWLYPRQRFSSSNRKNNAVRSTLYIHCIFNRHERTLLRIAYHIIITISILILRSWPTMIAVCLYLQQQSAGGLDNAG